jgi:hypothetical protein
MLAVYADATQEICCILGDVFANLFYAVKIRLPCTPTIERYSGHLTMPFYDFKKMNLSVLKLESYVDLAYAIRPCQYNQFTVGG